jgi:hypothetical protein
MSWSRFTQTTSACCALLLSACAAQVGDESRIAGLEQDVTRQAVDAQLDSTFYGGGRMRAYHAQPILNYALTVTTDNKIWVGGYYQSTLAGKPWEATAGRIDVNGGYDDWGTSQKIVGKANYAMLDMMPVGTTVLLGMSSPASGILSRLLPNSSSVDPSFGTSGEFLVRVPGTTNNWISAVAAGPNNTIVVAGRAWTMTGNVQSNQLTYVMRLLANGAPDPSFAVVKIPGDSAAQKSIRISVCPSKTFVLVHNTNDHIYAIDNDGTMDKLFGTFGDVLLRSGNQSQTRDLAARADGMVYVAEDGSSDINLTLLDKYGAAVTSFGSGGYVNLDYPGFTGIANLRLRYSDTYGRLFVAGDSLKSSKPGNIFVFAAFLPNGEPDVAFHDDGFWTTDFYTLADTQEMREIRVVGDKLLAMGQGKDSTGDGALLARYRIDHGAVGQPCHSNGTCNTGARCTSDGQTGTTYKICL